MKLDFLKTVPYVCKRWEEVVEKDPDAVFLTDELSGANFPAGRRRNSLPVSTPISRQKGSEKRTLC